MKLCKFIILSLLLIPVGTYANNLIVQKVQLTDTNTVNKSVIVKFDLSWENSWRDDVNWDAAWVFLKFKRANGSWGHVNISTSGHTVTTGNVPFKFAGSPDQKGTFVYRSTNGSGNNQLNQVKIAWNYGNDGLTDLNDTEIRVFAMEMVYIPTGAFAAGDGTNGKALRNAAYADYVIINDALSDPMTRTLSTGIITPFRINGLLGLDRNNDGVIEYPDFPSGYKSFYMMKYETTQGQMADLLNTISVASTENPVTAAKIASILGWVTVDNNTRQSISFQDSVYLCTRPDRAAAGMERRMFAFADWAAIRPMSELEYEKACRGPLPPIANEAAFGETFFYMSQMNQYMSINGTVEDGTEKMMAPGNYTQNPTNLGEIRNGDGGTGGFRVGIFATDTTSRISSGGSYYGVMDLTGNVAEFVARCDSRMGLKYNIHGDGMLSPWQNSASTMTDISDWGNYEDLTTESYKTTSVSALGINVYQLLTNIRGFRGVRAAPADN